MGVEFVSYIQIVVHICIWEKIKLKIYTKQRIFKQKKIKIKNIYKL